MKRLRSILSCWLLVWMGLLAPACGVEYPCESPVQLVESDEAHCYVDPAIEIAQGSIIKPIEGDPHVELGFYSEQLYAALQDGDACPVVYGLQGGSWTMPAIRTIGIGSPATVECSLTTELGELVGTVKSKAKFFLTPDGLLEIQSFPIPVRAESEDPLDDLYGLGATVTCSVRDDHDHTSSVTVQVVLEEG